MFLEGVNCYCANMVYEIKQFNYALIFKIKTLNIKSVLKEFNTLIVFVKRLSKTVPRFSPAEFVASNLRNVCGSKDFVSTNWKTIQTSMLSIMRTECSMEEFISGENFTTKVECCLSSRSIFLTLTLTGFFLLVKVATYIDYLFWRGIRASHIYFDDADGRWTLQSLKSSGRMSKLSANFSKTGYPFGRLTWNVQVQFLLK